MNTIKLKVKFLGQIQDLYFLYMSFEQLNIYKMSMVLMRTLRWVSGLTIKDRIKVEHVG